MLEIQTESKKSLNITQKSVPTTVTTNERTIISETKYFLDLNRKKITPRTLNRVVKRSNDSVINNTY